MDIGLVALDCLRDKGVWCSACKCIIRRAPVTICCLVSWEKVLLENYHTTQGLVLDLLLLSSLWQDLERNPSKAAAFCPVLLGRASQVAAFQKARCTLPENAAAAWMLCPDEEGTMARLKQQIVVYSHSMVSSMRRISRSLQPAQLDGNGLWRALCRTLHHVRFCKTFGAACPEARHALPLLLCGMSKHNHCLGLMSLQPQIGTTSCRNLLLEHVCAWARM